MGCFLNAGLTDLTHLDLFGARITDSGMNNLRCMLEDCSIYPFYSVNAFGFASIYVLFMPTIYT